jgi:hypothetical protein
MTEYSWISIRPNDQSQGKSDKDNKKTYFSATFWPPSVICAFSCPLHLLNQNQNQTLHAFSFASSFSRLLISFDHLLMISLSHSYVCDDDLSFLFLSSFVASCPAACFLHHYLLHLRRSLKAMVQKIGLFLHRHDDAQSLLHHFPFCAPFLLPHHLCPLRQVRELSGEVQQPQHRFSGLRRFSATIVKVHESREEQQP